MWKDDRMMPCNPIKTVQYNPNWGKGEFTCIHTLKEEDGPWWQAKFNATYVVSKVKILNRGDCCGGRLNEAKVFIGRDLCGTIENAK
jgi:hypothetical protein